MPAGTSGWIEGDEKTELGVNVDARWGRFSLSGQVARQDVAGLVRSGSEVEAGYRFSFAMTVDDLVVLQDLRRP